MIELLGEKICLKIQYIPRAAISVQAVMWETATQAHTIFLISWAPVQTMTGI